DALDPAADFGVFDYVFFNPPYDADGEGRPPSEARRGSYIADRPIGDWIKVWSNRMRAHAEMTLIHRAYRLRDILGALEGRLGSVSVFPIRPCADKPARRVIVRARKGSKGPLQIHKGLDLHPDDKSKDKYTPEAEAILRGEAYLGLW
ncbi:MAG TPA: methyltransferase, partial [Candidatus Binatia bacterium]|nr:methyltransferase [Candidatus Binatia bacterium]